MNPRETKQQKARKFPVNPKIAKEEIITDQSDPRMIKFRKDRGEFEPGYHKGNTVKLQITEYEAGLDEYQISTTIGFVKGGPSLFDMPLFREAAEKVILQVNEDDERKRWAKELNLSFRDYKLSDRKATLELWKTCELTQPWEEPAMRINRRIKANPDLVLLCLNDNKIIATVAGRCDENRGWIEYLAVHPSFRGKGIGRQLVKQIEQRLSTKGCDELGLLMHSGDRIATDFFQKLGYRTTSMAYIQKQLKNI